MGSFVNDYFRENDITGFSAMWSFLDDDYFVDSLIEEMIENNIPAIVSQYGTPVVLYNPDNSDKTKRNSYTPISSIDGGHYFTITSIITDRIKLDNGDKDAVVYEVSTWGEKLYIEKSNLDNCRKSIGIGEFRVSADPYVNVLWIHEK